MSYHGSVPLYMPVGRDEYRFDDAEREGIYQYIRRMEVPDDFLSLFRGAPVYCLHRDVGDDLYASRSPSWLAANALEAWTGAVDDWRYHAFRCSGRSPSARPCRMRVIWNRPPDAAGPKWIGYLYDPCGHPADFCAGHAGQRIMFPRLASPVPVVPDDAVAYARS
jgi:hypothetical protein